MYNDVDQISVKLSPSIGQTIRALAAKNNRSLSKQIRLMLSENIADNSYTEKEDEILNNIKNTVDLAMSGYTDRIAAISSKASIASAISMLLTNFMLHRIAKTDDAEKLDVFLHEIYLHAIKYVKTSDGGLEAFLTNSNDQIENAWKA